MNVKLQNRPPSAAEPSAQQVSRWSEISQGERGREGEIVTFNPPSVKAGRLGTGFHPAGTFPSRHNPRVCVFLSVCALTE